MYLLFLHKLGAPKALIDWLLSFRHPFLLNIFCFRCGINGLNRKFPEVENGLAAAQFSIGRAFQLGRGVKANLRKAQEYYNLASAQGHVKAQYNLGTYPPLSIVDSWFDAFFF